MEQKYVRHSKSGKLWLTAESAGSSYMASQCRGDSGLEKDLAAGWWVRFCWEDEWFFVFLMERKKFKTRKNIRCCCLSLDTEADLDDGD